MGLPVKTFQLRQHLLSLIKIHLKNKEGKKKKKQEKKRASHFSFIDQLEDGVRAVLQKQRMGVPIVAQWLKEPD